MIGMASQAGRRAKNKLGLKLNVASDTEKSEDNKSSETIDQEFEKMKIDETQKLRLMTFMEDKGKIVEMKRNDFERLEEIGFGSAGMVHKVKHIPTSIIMAQKIIRLEVKPLVRVQIMRELQVLHKCNSPYIVGYFGAFQDEGEIFLMMEYMDCGSLDKIYKKARRIPEPILGKITHNVLQGLTYLLSKHKVIHRDVKPSNILINSDGEIKICDFGVSGVLVDSMANSFVGTRSYMAVTVVPIFKPERLQGAKYTVRSDIWSLGVLFVELAIGRYPYPPIPHDKIILLLQDKSENSEQALSLESEQDLAIFELLDYIVHDEPPKLPNSFFSKEMCNFADQCLKKNPAERADLASLSNDPFVLKHKDINISDWIKNTLSLI